MAGKGDGTGAARVTLSEVRGLLVPPDDLRASVAYQNDINGLLAQLHEPRPPWRSVAPLFAPSEMLPAERQAQQERLPPKRAPRTLMGNEDTAPLPIVGSR